MVQRGYSLEAVKFSLVMEKQKIFPVAIQLLSELPQVYSLLRYIQFHTERPNLSVIYYFVIFVTSGQVRQVIAQ